MGRIILPDSYPAREGRARRNWDAASSNRLTSGWLSNLENSADELRLALPTLRARSRQLANNNEYAQRFLQSVRVNVAGPHGIKLQSRVGSSGSARAAEIDRKVEAAWARWCATGVPTLEGRMSFAEYLQHTIETVARDGEALSVYVTGAAARNEFGFALQCLDVSQIDDQKYGRDPLVFMGVEHDEAHRALAYHLKGDEATHTLGSRSVRTERVPASRVNHPFVVRRSLLRGVPWMAPVMMRVHMVGGYQEAEVTAARIAASKMGFYTRDQEAGPMDADDTDEEGRPMSEVEPGVFEALPAGWDFKAFDSQHPTTAYGQFLTTCLQGIAAGLGVPYHELTGDLSQANYSSLRETKLAGMDVWRALQTWLIGAVCKPVFARWLEWSITTGALAISMSDYERVLAAAQWQPRGWAWVDPEKELSAYEKALTLNLMTRSEILAAQGKDFEETLEQIAREQELMTEILMQQNQVVEDVRRLIDRVEQRHDEARTKLGDQIVEARAIAVEVRASVQGELARARETLTETAAQIEQVRALLGEQGQRLQALEGAHTETRAAVEKRFAELAEQAEQAVTAARGAQKVADRAESRVATTDSRLATLEGAVQRREQPAPSTQGLDGTRMQRSVRLDFVGAVQTRDGSESRSIEVAFSSEAPVERWFGMEVLDHNADSVDLSFVSSGRAPLLFNHDPDRIIGRVLSARIDADRKGRAVVEMPEGDPEAEAAWAKVRAGTLANVSVGYMIQKAEERTDETGKKPVVRITRWQPLEISLVAVPADTTVGAGRSVGA
jgi:lambda family phage portal protein/HK97 family phage prohead protease